MALVAYEHDKKDKRTYPYQARPRGVKLPGLRAERNRRLLTQQQLAKLADLSRYAIIQAEAGKPVEVPTAKKIAQVLKVKVQQLMEEPPAGPDQG